MDRTTAVDNFTCIPSVKLSDGQILHPGNVSRIHMPMIVLFIAVTWFIGIITGTVQEARTVCYASPS